MKPFQRTELFPAIDIALGRFAEMKALEDQVKDLTERLEVRKVVEKAKGILMDADDLSESAAFSWIQRTAMDQRVRMDVIARRVIDDGLRVTPS
ncbi:MAG TPA: ANTAR domain-containing protein [Acidimicrobiales bacterium]|nr:ANTAR domain-containing protein [Acidimicrobiales bacterium]